MELSRFFKVVSWTPETKERAGVAITRFGRIYLQINADKMMYHKELVSREYKAEQVKDPFPRELYQKVKDLMTAADEKSKAIYTLIDFIYWSGCRPIESIEILSEH